VSHSATDSCVDALIDPGASVVPVGMLTLTGTRGGTAGTADSEDSGAGVPATAGVIVAIAAFVCPNLGLFQHPNNLLHGKTLLLHRQNPPPLLVRSWPKTNMQNGSKNTGADVTGNISSLIAVVPVVCQC
jgi:hypothetical protein